ncbi:hypothetical protein PENTCL1PPCAC_22991, partial [Pristionchus entomophagus]
EREREREISFLFRTYGILSSLVDKEINGVNQVYKDTDFNGIKNVEFALYSLKVYKTKEDPENRYANENLDVNAFLAVNAKQNHGDVCLGYTFTYRDFAGGTLGLAYVGTVCAPHRAGSESQASANAGIVTYLNRGQPVLERISYLTLAHEIGHNFGSPHDETDECKGGDGGQFIMWYSATSGDQQNNKKFSKCSIDKMSAVLHNVMKIEPIDQNAKNVENQSGARNCFVPSGSPICGNGIVEGEEECDCGGKEGCELRGEKHLCCDPLTCKLVSGKACSPSQGLCCDDTCNIKASTEQCKEGTECTLAAMCRGPPEGGAGAQAKEMAERAKCPEPDSNKERAPCLDVTGICYRGECNTSMVCTSVHLEDCDSEEKTCMRHCKKGEQCIPTSKLDEFNNPLYKQEGRWGHSGLMLGPRSQCMKGKGMCNKHDICNKVQAFGSLSRNMGKIVAGLQSFGDLMIEKIWVLILVVIGVVAILVIVIKFCSYATPSSNPNKPKAKSIKQIKNMMSDRVKRISNKRKPKKGKGESPPPP